MRTTLAGWYPVLALAGAVGLSAIPAHAAPAPTGEAIALRLLTELQAVSGVPGIGAAYWNDGRIAWTGSAGLRDLENNLPVTRDTRFRFASISKLFAATGAARLWQQGRLDVDAPIAPMLPWLGNGWAPITTRQVAAHIAGIGHYQPGESATIGSRAIADMPGAVAIFSGRPLLSVPGTRYEYSTYGFTLLSAVVETKAKMPYLDYLSKVVAPGLAIGPDYTGRDPLASRAYLMVNGAPVEAPKLDYSYSWGGAGLGGTPSALAEWGGRIATGKVVSPATVRWMATPAKYTDGRTVNDGTYDVGFGWRSMTDLDGNAAMLHAGATPGARGVLIVLPGGRGSAISLLANAMWTASIEKSAFAIAAPLRPAPVLAAKPCPLKAARYTGALNGEAIAGTASFAMEGGLCTATLSADNALGKWIGGTTRNSNPRLRFIGIDPNGGLPRGALISPFGAWEMRPDPAGAYAIQLGTNRSLTLNFE
ncbi:serine hydrolase domain-containing protein [Sphingomonas sp. G-3-2-10]|uniref:serine hydrolase domain-containing protein n=1 Tax=Sphingomonas sp. G-3-2-10 TaxID=2728838 RepID=UPI001469E797|nr:serine hydrolase domain-containing protein [Sphingomonas sp. G-3-2-10]NML05022.1 beta-lactamase family protein [Sphingomonas sp. G-3-2-10]